MSKQTKLTSKQEIQDWLISTVSRSLELDPSECSANVTFDRLGMNSVTAVQLTGDLETLLGLRLPPTLLYDHSSIDTLSSYLAKQLAAANPATHGAHKSGITGEPA